MKYTEKQLKNLLKKARRSSDGKDLYAICPKCGHDEFGISLTKDGNPFNCFRKKACGWSGKIWHLLKFFGIKNKKNAPTYDVETVQFMKIEEYEEEPVLKEELAERKAPIGFRRIFDHEYLKSRGYTEDDFKTYQVGYTKADRRLKHGYIVIRIPQGDIFPCYLARTQLSKEECEKRDIRRYLNSLDNFGYFLDGLNEYKSQKRVCLTEGHFDRISVRNALPGEFVCSSFGAKVSEKQVEILKELGIEEIVLFFDGDVPIISEKVGRKLSIDFKVEVCQLPFNKDPGDLPDEQIKYIFDKRKNLINYNANSIKRL